MCGANAQQARRRCDPSVHIHRCRATMKSCIRQVHFRQHQNQHNKKQQGHQYEQTRRLYRPAPHGGRSVTRTSATSTPQKCHTATEVNSTSEQTPLTREDSFREAIVNLERGEESGWEGTVYRLTKTRILNGEALSALGKYYRVGEGSPPTQRNRGSTKSVTMEFGRRAHPPWS